MFIVKLLVTPRPLHWPNLIQVPETDRKRQTIMLNCKVKVTFLCKRQNITLVESTQATLMKRDIQVK